MKINVKSLFIGGITFGVVLLLCLHPGKNQQVDSQQVITGMEEKKKIALTFDDGPHPIYTEPLLDGLKERQVPVTFFVTGQNAVLYPELINRMNAEGHLVGNHTYTHLQLTNQNKEKFKKELILTSEVIEKILGESPIYVRPPYGSWDKKIEDELNMFPVLWTIDTLDWNSQNTQKILKRGTCGIEENDIILMHGGYETSVEAAFLLIEFLQKEGFEFVTVDKLLFG